MSLQDLVLVFPLGGHQYRKNLLIMRQLKLISRGRFEGTVV